VKRDLDLIRRLLLDIEEEGSDASRRAGWTEPGDNGQAPDTVHYHIQLMHDAGLIIADELVPGQWWPERITWAGHEFLDLARNEDLWHRAKRAIETAAGAAPFQVLQELLARNVREALERPAVPPGRTKKK